jgi:hypothetical protein
VSPDEGADIDSHFLSAEEVELRPLIAEAEESLELDRADLAELEAFLSEAWFFGVRAGHSQMLERARQRKVPIGPVYMKPVEAEFQSLMEKLADALNLPVTRTILVWELLGRAWVSGTRSYQAEVAARLLEGGSDVAEEALEWLDGDQE